MRIDLIVAPAPAVAPATTRTQRDAKDAQQAQVKNNLEQVKNKILKSTEEYNAFLKNASNSGLEKSGPVKQTSGKNEWKITDKLTLQITDTLDVKIIPDKYIPSELEAIHVTKLTEIVRNNKDTTIVEVKK